MTGKNGNQRKGKRPSKLRNAILRPLVAIWEWKFYLGPAVGLIVTGILFLGRYHETSNTWYKLLGLFSSELGFAILIAVLVFWMIEQWTARQHCKTAIGLLYGVRPEGAFFDKIEEYVLKQKFYRSGVDVTYAFEEQDEEDILVHQSVEYTLWNVCTKDDFSDFPLAGRVDLKPLKAGKTRWDGQLGLRSLAIDRIPVGKDGVERRRNSRKRYESYRKKEDIRLPYKGNAHVAATHHLVKHDHDNGVWLCAIPSTDIELRLTWKDPIHLKFVVDAVHPDPALGSLTPAEDKKGVLVYKLKAPFLKGHGFHFHWSRETEDNETAQAAAVSSAPGTISSREP